jgi:hypothetical protein
MQEKAPLLKPFTANSSTFPTFSPFGFRCISAHRAISLSSDEV